MFVLKKMFEQRNLSWPITAVRIHQISLRQTDQPSAEALVVT